VVQSLLYGLESRDKVADLIVRVCELPKELDELFSVMLGRISPRHRAQAFRLLYITQQLLPHVDDYGVHALVLSYAEEYGYTTKSLPKSGLRPSTELEDRQQEIEVVVRSRCLGLLEVSLSENPFDFELTLNDNDSQRLTKVYKVDYIHKTVAEYLDNIDIQARVAETSIPTFDVNVAILNALVITCRHVTHFGFIKTFSHFNRQSEQSTKRAQIAAVDELDTYLSDPRILNMMKEDFQRHKTGPSQPDGSHWANYLRMEDHIRPRPWHDTILAFAIRCGWELYVTEKLREHGSGLPTKRGRPLLDYAVYPEPVRSPYVYGMNQKIVKCLLEHGANPNATFDGYSAWSNALSYVDMNAFHIRLRRHDIVAHALQVMEVMKLLLAYGADKKAPCTSTSGETSAAEVVRLAIPDPHNKCPQEVRDGLREVLAIIEDEGEDRILAAPFAGSSRSRLQNTVASYKASLSQRIKVRLLKRTR
jgi:hypothetical protein